MAVRISPESLRSLGSEVSYARGPDYANQGRVSVVSQQGQTVRAIVTGSQPYTVRLFLDEDESSGHCSCPLGDQDAFCKHCVALAIAWSAHGPDHHIAMPEPEGEPNLEEAALALSHDMLIHIVVDAAERNPALAAELLARDGMLPEPGTPALAVMRARVASALPDEPLENWDAWYDIEALLDELTDLVRRACSDEVIMLIEDTMSRWETAVEMIEHETPEADDLATRLALLHHEACRLARPDPVPLARRLLDLHLVGYFALDLPDGYADVLGQQGLAAFEAEVWSRLDEVPTTQPGDQLAYEHDREALMQLAVSLAEAAGDVDRLVNALAKNLNRPSKYTHITGALHEAGRAEEALHWAQEGLAAYGGKVDADLLDTTLTIHQKAGRVEDGRDEARRAFASDPSFETYQRMATWCRDLPGWDDQRRRAIETVRRAVDQPDPRRERPDPDLLFHGDALWRPARTNELVHLFLWDGDDEAAWREACESSEPLSDRLCWRWPSAGHVHTLWTRHGSTRSKPNRPSKPAGTRPTLSQRRGSSASANSCLPRATRKSSRPTFLESGMTTSASAT